MTPFDPLIIVWALISLWSLTSIFLYEYFIVGVTLDDLEAEETPEEVQEEESETVE
jgi:hypothetical protein|tara:strand:- start:95 stop:262 length:168 start_codon:yes stop_codon:yes gene_type:complete